MILHWGDTMARRDYAAILKKLDWKHLLTELFVVVLGVFLGMQVSNWNDERRDAARVERLLEELRPQIEVQLEVIDYLDVYYENTLAYGDDALAGFASDASVSDRDFVIGAYQASQVQGNGLNVEIWAAIFGGDMVLEIDDPSLRLALANVLASQNNNLDWRMLDTRYREHVRRVIPDDIQRIIRTECTDIEVESERTQTTLYALPAECEIDLPDERFAAAARLLRAAPDLTEELLEHRSDVAAFTFNGQVARESLEALRDELAEN